jgi:hypothetical protein
MTKPIGLYNIFKTAQVRVTHTISFTLLFNRLLASFFSQRRRRQPLPISERLNPQIPDRARYNIRSRYGGFFSECAYVQVSRDRTG